MRLPSTVRFVPLLITTILCLGAAPANFPAPGESTTKIQGCLAKAKSRTAMPRGSMKDTTGPDVRIEKHPQGITISHHMKHACCLTGEVTTTVVGHTVTVVETLSGNPCRCLCASTIAIDVGLKSGTYNLSITVAQKQSTQVVHHEAITVP